MELRQLEAFMAVATELHFGRAANRLHIAAPTLSELIRRLECGLGTPLLTRTTRRVALTSAGAELLSRWKVILERGDGSGRGVGVLHGGRELLGALLRRRRIHPHDLPAVAVEVEEAA